MDGIRLELQLNAAGENGCPTGCKCVPVFVANTALARFV